jgi:hypothetical protein
LAIHAANVLMSYEVDGTAATVNANSFGAGMSFLFGS